MKRITLTFALIAAASSAAAQTWPAVPPAAIAPVAPMPPAAIEANREAQRAFIEANREAQRIAAQDARDAQRFAFDAARSIAPMEAMAPMMPMTPMAPMAPMAPMPAMSAYDVDRFDHLVAPAGWAKGDPADSAYRVAREVLNKGDWGRAARLFADIAKSYPQSVYQNQAVYYEAYARYKIGTTDELRSAAKTLEPLAMRTAPQSSSSQQGQIANFYDSRRTNDSDIRELYTRINGTLAQRGDSDAAAKVAKFAQAGGSTCDQEDLQVRTEALNALSQMDPTQALPMLRRVLDKKDECSAPLRRNAAFILGRRNDTESAALLMQVAKSDPNTSVRTEAINYLARVPGDNGLNALEDMLKTEQDERIQRAAVRALMSSDNQRARTTMRALIDRKDAPMGLRIEAINSINSDRATTDDAAYLRGLFGKAENDQMKNAIVNAVSRIAGAENDQWVMGIARNTGESSSVRSNALSRLSRSPTLTTADLSKLYDASSESFDMRQRIISMLGNRKDPESTDKLIDIVRNSTVLNNRTQAINALQSKKDPRATQALMDVLDGKKP